MIKVKTVNSLLVKTLQLL